MAAPRPWRLNRGVLRRWASVLLILSWALVAYRLGVPGPLDREGGIKGGDFHHFYVLGAIARDGPGDALYDPHAQSERVGDLVAREPKSWFPRPAHGPQLALLMRPFAAMPFVPALLTFMALSLLLYGSCVQALLRMFPALRADRALVWILALASPALWYVIRFGQTTALGLTCVALGLIALASRRPFLAGLAIGGLFYKPQLGMVFGLVWLLAGEWAIVAGAISAVALQLAAGFTFFGSSTMAAYARAAWGLIVDRTGSEPIPHHLHSVRGFLSLLVPGGATETTLYLAATAALVWLGHRTWRSSGPLPLRYGQLVLLTVLASLHLTVYDLVVLVPVFLAVSAYLLEHDPPHSREIALLLVVIYVAPVLGASLTYFTRIQISVPAMCWLAYRLYRLAETKSSNAADTQPYSVQRG